MRLDAQVCGMAAIGGCDPEPPKISIALSAPAWPNNLAAATSTDSAPE
jgi:hypothetical protein